MANKTGGQELFNSYDSSKEWIESWFILEKDEKHVYLRLVNKYAGPGRYDEEVVYPLEAEDDLMKEAVERSLDGTAHFSDLLIATADKYNVW